MTCYVIFNHPHKAETMKLQGANFIWSEQSRNSAAGDYAALLFFTEAAEGEELRSEREEESRLLPATKGNQTNPL